LADNGRAPGFNDRRGSNPFQPVASARLKVRTDHRQVERPFESYNGQGARQFNGRKGYSLNGMTISRKSPDEQKRYETELKLGIRREGEV
jgi:hypothetical protein